MSETEPIPPTSSVTALRIPIIKKGEYDLWSMKMRQYIAITDHILWDIITNGNQTTTDPASPSVCVDARSLWKPLKQDLEKPNASRDAKMAYLKLLMKFTVWVVYELELKGVSNSTLKTLLFCHRSQGSTEKKWHDNSRRIGSLGEDRKDPLTLRNNRANGRNEKWMEFDAEPVTYAMMALTEVEKDDWSMEFDAEHVHFGQDGLGDFDWSNKDDDTPVSLALMATNSEKGSTVKKSAMINPKQTWRPKGNYLDSVNRDNGSYTLKQFEYGNPEEDLKDYAIIDSGCSGSMTGDKDKLSDFKEFKGGYVAFGNDSKGGRISGKGTIKTSCLDFEKVSYVEELKFNLLSVSQICDKKHNVLFTDKECLILSPKFKFVDEDLVILRAPRKNDVYSLDLKNIIPSGGITCLVAKATEDEAVLWHRRLGHVNFKNINKLVKGNLVKGLPSKTFKIDHSCLACNKVHTDDNVADLLTKGFDLARFNFLVV
ncbi:ribonuclease H-like domain-containing protein, partial [Tanacetum coccineum]